MKKLLILATGAILFVVCAIIALTGEKSEVYQGLLICLGLLCVGIAVITANKQQQIAAPPPQAKKYPSRNLFGDEVDTKEDLRSDNTQSYMIWAFLFIESGGFVFWILGMVFYFKVTAFLTVVTVVALIVRSCSKSTLEEAGVKLEQDTSENYSKLST